jgi:hypothetical protein
MKLNLQGEDMFSLFYAHRVSACLSCIAASIFIIARNTPSREGCLICEEGVVSVHYTMSRIDMSTTVRIEAILDPLATKNLVPKLRGIQGLIAWHARCVQKIEELEIRIAQQARCSRTCLSAGPE